MPAAVMAQRSAPSLAMATAPSIRRRQTPTRAAALASSSRVTLEDLSDEEVILASESDYSAEDGHEAAVDGDEQAPDGGPTLPKATSNKGQRIGKGNFHCEWPGCFRTFPRQIKLQIHMRTHTDERPFKCALQDCGSAFKRKEHLKAHEERLHTVRADASPSSAPQQQLIFSSEPGLPVAEERKKHVCRHLGPVAAPALASPSAAGKGKAHSVVEVSTLECGRRFWTKQHLDRHIADVHEDEDTLERIRVDSGAHAMEQEGESDTLVRKARKQYQVSKGRFLLSKLVLIQAHPPQCTEPGCLESFAKRKRLREHIWAKHSLLPEKGLGSAAHLSSNEAIPLADATSGSIDKPFVCSYAGCGRAFLTNAKRKQHSKVHAEGRYTCSLPHPHASNDTTISEPAQGPLDFPTWSALQTHMRDAHPPICPLPQCKGKVFKSGARLTKHMKQHREGQEKQRSAYRSEAFAGEDDEDGEDQTAEEGDIACPWAGCSRAFKSGRSMQSHCNIRHLGIKKFVCGVTDVGQGSHPTVAAPDSELSTVDDVANAAAVLSVEVGCGRAFGHKHELVRHLRTCEVRKMEALLVSMESAASKDGRVLGKLGPKAKARAVGKRSRSSDAERQGNQDDESDADNRDVPVSIHDGEEGHASSGEDFVPDSSEEMDEGEVDDELFREEGGAVPQRLAGRPAAPERSTRNAITHSQVRALLGLGQGGEKEQSTSSKKRGVHAAGLDDADDREGVLKEWREYLPASLLGGQKKRRKMRGAMLTCPWRRLNEMAQGHPTLAGEDEGEQEADDMEDPSSINTLCEARFSRVYDLSRHLRSAHSLRLSDGDILELVPEQERQLLPKSRK